MFIGDCKNVNFFFIEFFFDYKLVVSRVKFFVLGNLIDCVECILVGVVDDGIFIGC